MHKDLSDDAREGLGLIASAVVVGLNEENESLAIAREAMINAFDEAAANVTGA